MRYFFLYEVVKRVDEGGDCFFSPRIFIKSLFPTIDLYKTFIGSVAILYRTKWSHMNATILMVNDTSSGVMSANGYIIGGVLALFILGYFLYSLVKPEKF
jgi:K+-transporting ATPase KdpF subunit